MHRLESEITQLSSVGVRQESAGDAARRVAYVVNHVAFFVSHRLPLALEAIRRGWKVWLYTGRAGSDLMEEEAVSALTASDIQHIRLEFGSSTINPLRELLAVFGLVRWLRRSRPHIVHCASPKGVLYGGVAARLSRTPALVLAISGMGYLFSGPSVGGWSRKLLQRAYVKLLQYVFRHPNKKVIVQNQDDRRWFLKQGLASEGELVLIPGSGVGREFYEPADDSRRQSLVVLPARMLSDKGVEDFVEAVRMIKPRLPGWRFVLAGTADYRNPSSISAERIEGWVKEGLVEWLGHVKDMPGLLKQASIVCLPSYREGMPKALLEAAAAGCAVVTTDTIGCREAIIPGETGDLVPVRNPAALGAVLLELALDDRRRESYGRSGRILAERKFGLDAVVNAVFQIYDELGKESQEG